MKRTRGRMFPSVFCTDRRIGRLTALASNLFPYLWVNLDDQGRISGDSDEVKYTCCPNMDHFAKRDIPALLQELHDQKLIIRYRTSKGEDAIQAIDWWDSNNKLQWAWPSNFEPPAGWTDHLRHKMDAKTIYTLNWPPQQLPLHLNGNTPPPENSGENDGEHQVSGDNGLAENSGEDSGEDDTQAHLNDSSLSPEKKKEPKKNILNEKEKGNRRGRGNIISPENSGELSGENSPEKTTASSDSLNNSVTNGLCTFLTTCFTQQWARFDAATQQTQLREPDFREKAQLRDLAVELHRSCPNIERKLIQEAFGEASQYPEKMTVAYVRSIILDWAGVPR